MNEFLLGGIVVGHLTAGLFFLRYWISSRDRFFLFFMASFWLESGNRAFMVFTQSWNESAPIHYVVRLVSYALILIALWDKNRPGER